MFSDSYLGEDGGPDGLNLDVGGLDQSLELVGLRVGRAQWSANHVEAQNARCDAGRRKRQIVGGGGKTYSDINAIVGEDQRRVGRSELGSRHCD